jgi:GTPase SAR1 family protein
VKKINNKYCKKMMISEYGDESSVPTYKVIIIGKTQSGKTKLLTRYKYGTYIDEGVTTAGVDSFRVKTNEAEYSYFDTCGQ